MTTSDLALLVLISVFLVVLTGCRDPLAHRKEYAEDIIFKVEKFRSNHQRLPRNVQELGLKADEASPAFYEAKSENDYIVWYGEELGESKIWDSKTKVWKSR